MPKYLPSYEPRRAQRQISRNMGIPVADGPSLEDAERDLAPDETPTLDSMTRMMDTPRRIADVGEAPVGRVRSEEGDWKIAKARSHGRADFAEPTSEAVAKRTRRDVARG
jgi:hypothetical protein